MSSVMSPPVGGQQGQRQETRGQRSRELERARHAAELLFGTPRERGFAVTYWNSGVTEKPSDEVPFTLILADAGALRRAFLPPTQLRIGRAFVRGDFDVAGDLEAATRSGEDLRQRLADPARLLAATAALAKLPHGKSREGSGRSLGSARLTRRHSRTRDAAAIRSHYDVGNEFYQLWLDRRMVYSCGYFPTGQEDIHQAQEAKLDLICRKLRLKRGERLLDIGCGWGGLIMFAAEHYGVDATGITLSPAQAELGTERFAQAGLADRCRIEVRDYRTLGDEQFDKVASVGMCEHVGHHRLGEYFHSAWRALKPGGLFLNHCITQGRQTAGRLGRRLWREGSFTNRFVFPDGELPALTWLVEAADAAGFEPRDAESLREHYARTLRWWVARL
ncbi:MAG TPA: cyclopropane-fatty-acyl-phospholipid synthase family protein, partial [Gemmatimonadales bacterium]|nr:cyclopropane-fatty-acyl-phospholipid synthase family protein [Gemmatimonadales bacterium]